MSFLNNNEFNTEPLLNEINNVLSKGLTEIFKNFINEHKLYKETYQGLMKLAGIEKNGLVINGYNDTNSYLNQQKKDDSQIEEIIKNKVDQISSKLNDKLDEFIKYNLELTSILISKIDNCNSEIQLLKNPIIDLTNVDVDVQIKQEPVEKENIVLKIEEEEEKVIDSEVDETNEEEEESEASVEDETKEEEEEEEEASVEDETKEEEEESEASVEDETKEEEEEEASVEDETKEEEEEEEEFIEIEIVDITYCTNDEENGFIYELDKDGDIGKKVGYIKEGEPFFYD